MSQPLATLTPSPARRLMGTGTVGLLGVLLLWIALTTAPTFGWRLTMALAGGLFLLCAARLWQATAHRIELMADALRDTSGRLHAPLAEIASVDRGTFAFKPSNGFVVVMRNYQPRGWAPGLWWRVGRRIGIGGVTSGTEAKAMAEILALHLASTRTDATDGSRPDR